MSLRNIIIIIAVIVLLASGSAYTVFTLVGPPWGAYPAQSAAGGDGGVKAPGPIYNAGTMVVNLSAHGVPSTRFVRAGIAFELDSDNARKHLEQREEQVRDRIISVVRQQTPESIADENGMNEMRSMLKNSISELLPEGNVVNVFFFDLVVQ